MKTLFLLRHAEAPMAYDMVDFDRPLSVRGNAQAQALGTVMVDKGYEPDLVQCSSAVRTRQTLAGVESSITIGHVEHKKSIYNASTGDLLSMVQETSSDINSVLIIGHNPTIYDFVRFLSRDEITVAYNTLLMSGYAPATLSVLSCDITDWKDIQPAENRLTDILRTAEYVPDV